MRRLTIERTTFFILVALLLAMAVRVPVDTDTWWHLRSGEYVLNNGTITADPFSHTKAGETWINHSWGAQIIMYGAYQLAADAGLALFQALLAAGGLLLLFRVCAGTVYLRAFVLVLGAATAAVFWSARPQMLSFFLSCALIVILYEAKQQRSDRLWLIPPLMWLWGNLHAGYSIGFIFLGGVIVGEIVNQVTGAGGEHVLSRRQILKLIGVTLLAPLVMLINPYGLDMLLVPFNTVGIASLREFIQEWNSPNFQGRETWAFIGMLLLLIAGGWQSRLRFDWTYFFLVGGTLFMALLYGRNIAVFAVVAIPLLTYHLDSVLTTLGVQFQPRRTVSRSMARVNLLLLIVVALGALVYILNTVSLPVVEEAQAEALPVAAADYLNDTNPPGPMFNSYNWGGYLMFAAPQYPVFIDGRTDLYNEFLRVYLNTTLAGDNWRETLDEYDIRLVVVEREGGLAVALRDEPGWSLDYEDEKVAIFTREAA